MQNSPVSADFLDHIGSVAEQQLGPLRVVCEAWNGPGEKPFIQVIQNKGGGGGGGKKVQLAPRQRPSAG